MASNMYEDEPLLKEDPTRYTMFPLKHYDLWMAYKNHMKAFWTEDEIDFSADKPDWNTLSNDEKYFIEHILAFFAGSDGIVLENLIENFACEVQVPEARAFYGFQAMIENIHCVSGDTQILTSSGYLPIKSIVNEIVEVWNGTEWSYTKVQFTGIDELYKVTLNNGMTLDCTSDHEWLTWDGNVLKKTITTKLYPGVELKKTKYPVSYSTYDEYNTNPYLDGFYNAYNMMNKYTNRSNNSTVTLFEPHYKYVPFLVDNEDCVSKFSKCVKLELKNVSKMLFNVPVNSEIYTKVKWLQGLLDYAGILTIDNLDNQYVSFLSVHYLFMKDVQLMLTTLNVCSTLETISSNVYRLVINEHNINKLEHFGLRCDNIHGFMINKSHYSNQPLSVVSVEKLDGVYETYCFNENKQHMGVFNGILTGQSTTYSLLIDTFIEDPVRKNELFNAIQTIPCVSKKADWAIKWIDKSRPFGERLIAFIIVEGIFFSGSFCAIFWLKSKGKMTRALGLSNEFIARDEGLHTDFGVLMYNKLRHRLDRQRVLDILTEAVEIEREFICDSLPCALIGMNSELMYQYIKFVADRLLVQLGYDKYYNVENPFDFMNNLALSGKTNFFEKRITEYQNASASIKQEDKNFDFDDDF